MPWPTKSVRRAQLPPDWPARRHRALRRDHYRCTHRLTDGTRCPSKATDVHHIGASDNHEPGNLTSLCAPHHSEHTTAEGHAAMRTARAKAKHPTERHPGRSD